ncbi:MAG: substrate-binding domain-containing protein [Prevotella sp.]|jgi:signal transduction histidine kinase/DNA-binding response OmpR family regulator/ABC-type xylose transport system substrate-binding protein|nr:substrate-binding domain-containing protein [Prevotella sp.]MCI1282511.1 substrate-binding domain-containing protein [Prevotella sp.]
MKRTIFLNLYRNILITLLLPIIFSACSHHEKHYVIGVSQCSEDIWRNKLNDELSIASFSYDNVDIHFASADDNDQRQIEQINKFIDEDVDLLVASPNQMHTISPAIERAYNKGIPVILFDRKTDSHKYTAFIGADNYEIGRVMGEYIGTALKGKGNVVEITGLQTSSPAIDRHRGFCDALKSFPNIRLIDSMHGDWTKESGETAMEKLLKSQQNIDCVFGQNDRMAMGARQAAERHGLKNTILYIGIDGLPTPDGGLHNVAMHELAASYIYPTRGDLVMQLAMNILKKKPFKKENYLKATIVTPDNARAMLMQVDEMNHQRTRLIELHDKVDQYLAQYNHQQIYLLLSVIILLLLAGFFIYVYRTIAMKRRMAEETANAKLQFFTNVSHEFRTPLTLIADPVERLLDDEDINDNQRSLLQVARKNVNVMLRLVSEILDFRKVQNGKMKVNNNTFDLAEHLRQWINGFMPAATTKKISIETDIPQSLKICADLDKTERICYNLLSNALKYTHDGGHIKVSANENDGKVALIVEDNGIGIPKDKVQHIFDRFYQAENNNVGGTGIGLALVKAFAELMGGIVNVKSIEGQGSQFTVLIPIGDIRNFPEEEPSVSSGQKEAFTIAGETMTKEGENSELKRITSPTNEEDKPTVLVVDDNDDVRAYIASLLSQEYEVKSATDGQLGLERAIKEVPDLIICDVMMPVMDGLEMCNRVKHEIATSHIPVILLTARTQEDQRAEGYDYGADAYITKPFSGKVLLSRVKNLLANRRLLHDVFSNGETTDDKPTDTDTLFINEFRKQVQAQMSDSELNVETLSADMGLSRVQLYRKVKALTGSSPVELIRITRLKRAERLLKSGGKTISEVSYDVGFSSPSYFTKCYKEYFGILPGEVK